jgi:hypothetical protein
VGVKDWRPGTWEKHGEVLVRVAGNLGDKNPFDYGGLIVFDVWQKQPDHMYVAAERWSEPTHSEDPSNDRYWVYRFDVEPNVLNELDWVDWNAIARFVGIERHAIERMATSNDPLERA